MTSGIHERMFRDDFIEHTSSSGVCNVELNNIFKETSG